MQLAEFLSKWALAAVFDAAPGCTEAMARAAFKRNMKEMEDDYRSIDPTTIAEVARLRAGLREIAEQEEGCDVNECALAGEILDEGLDVRTEPLGCCSCDRHRARNDGGKWEGAA